MRARLLTPEAMKALALTKDIGEFLEYLSKTSYREEISEERRPINATNLETIFNQTFLRMLERIIRVCPEGLSEFLRTYYCARLEINNLKRILRGRFSKLPIERIRESLTPLEPYESISLEELLVAERVEDFIDSFRGTPYAPLKESLVLSEKHDTLWPVEARLNYLHVEAVQGVLSKIPPIDRGRVRRMVEVEADVENLLLAINWRGVKEALPPPENVFPHAYGFSPEVIGEIIQGRRLDEATASLGPPYTEILRPVLEDDFALVRTNLRRHIYEMSGAGRVRDDFSFPCIVSYLTSCDVERGDLVAIAWGKERGVEPGRIFTYSVLPAYAP